MSDTKMVKLVGEHWVCSVMAGFGWGVALTRDGLERTDILAVHQESRRTIEVQVKTASHMPQPNWRLGLKAQSPERTDHEWFVLVSLAAVPAGAHRAFVVPRNHVAAAAWISHQHWLTEPGVVAGKRTAGHDQARVPASVFEGYEGRWDLLNSPTPSVAVMLPLAFKTLALGSRVGLPAHHPWRDKLPDSPGPTP